MNRYFIGLAFAGLLTMGSTMAQQINFKQQPADLAGPKHKLFVCPGGDYLSITWHFNDDKDPFTIARFDPQTFAQRYTNDIADFSTQHYQAAFYTNGRLFIISNDKDGAVSKYEINDKNGTLAGTAQPLYTLEGEEEVAKFYSGSSPNGKFNYFVSSLNKKKENGKVLQGAIIDGNGNKTGSFSYATPEDRDDFTSLDLTLTDNGDLMILYGTTVKAKKDNYIPVVYSAVQVDAKGQLSAGVISGLPVGKLSNLSLVSQRGRFLMTALISKEKKKGSTSFFSGVYDPAQKKCTIIEETGVAELMTQAPAILEGIKKEGLPEDVALLRSYTFNDGSVELVMEQNGDRFYQSHYAPNLITYNTPMGQKTMGTPANKPSYSMTFHSRGNIYVCRLDKTGAPQWMRVISKTQEEADFVLSVGLVCTTDERGNLRFLFYDHSSNREPAVAKPELLAGTRLKNAMIACVTVDPEGELRKQMVSQQEPDYRYMFEKESCTDAGNKILVMSIKPKSSMFPEKFFKRATYRLNTIELK